jgi:hypothetical protein
MKTTSRLVFDLITLRFFASLRFGLPFLCANSLFGQAIILDASKPTALTGGKSIHTVPAARSGSVLLVGQVGNWLEYQFRVESALTPAELRVRYSRKISGTGYLRVHLDGADLGLVGLPSTGGWGLQGDAEFGTARLRIPALEPGVHVMRLTVALDTPPAPSPRLLPADPVLDRVGARPDKNSVGHGRNVALYTGKPTQFFYATHNLGNVFDATDGATLLWFPDYVVLQPQAAGTLVALDQFQFVPTSADAAAPMEEKRPPGLSEQRQVCVTEDDVTVSRFILTNATDTPLTRELTITGDCRDSVDYRGKPGGRKTTVREGNFILLTDGNVFPAALPEGLAMAIGSSLVPEEADTSTGGAYRLRYQITVPPHSTQSAVFACAFGRDAAAAKASLTRVLADPDPLASNRAAWRQSYETELPQFTCSDARLTELYGLRWFLLKFSTVGGDLGLFQYPVVIEGREAYQTYCCYSAPFMAFDLNWAKNPATGFGHLMNMPLVAYPDGRFPWYATPATAHVPIDHASGTGQSLMPWTAWKFYQIHGDKVRLGQLYPSMKKNVDWWIADRDPDGNGLFSIDHQLETGMDDLHRRWLHGKPKRYEAIDATSYAYLNIRAVAGMAAALGMKDDAAHYSALAEKSSGALHSILWDPILERYRDRNPETGELTDYNSLTIFYPLFAMAGDAAENVRMARRYLLNPREYGTPYPIPGLSQSDPEFDPDHRYWAGPSWPATNSHIFEGLAALAKKHDRSLMPKAAELFQRMVALHVNPRADFYERYHSLTGTPLSSFRDYMHSWWIEPIIRHVAGLEIQEDGSLTIDPLPLGLASFSLHSAPWRGRSVDVLWNDASAGLGLVVRVDGRSVLHQPDFQPGGNPVSIPDHLIPHSP